MRYRQILLLLTSLMLLFSCGKGLPDGVLSRKKMVPVLVDIHLAEAINNQKFNLSMNRDSLQEDLYLSICKKHKIERSEIEKSLLYYGKHTKEYIPIYVEVLDVLSEMAVKAKSDTLRPVRIGGFDLDTAKVKKSPPATSGADRQIK